MPYRVVQLPLAPTKQGIEAELNVQERAGYDLAGVVGSILIFKENERTRKTRVRILTGDRG